MKRRLIIDIDTTCDTLSKELLEEHFQSMLEDIVYNIDELTYFYPEDSDEEHVVRTTSDYIIKDID